MDIPERIKKFEPLWGSWHIDEFIGEGGFGSVYKIKREGIGDIHYCALKHIQIPHDEREIHNMAEEGADDETLKLYYKSVVEDIYGEIRLMEKLKGTSHIVSYEDYLIIPKENAIGYDIFIRMEYLSELKKYYNMAGMKKEDIIKLGIDLCSGLELCQKYNILHRDIKPDNIYVSPNGDFKLGDFGISRQLEKTLAGARIGTPDYMAPEVYRGEKYNSAVDIYSIGLVMYRLLNNNRMPFMPPYPEKFTAKDRDNAFAKRINGDTLPFPQSGKDKLAEIVLKACSYDKRDRYPSPAVMRMELEKIRYAESREEEAVDNTAEKEQDPDKTEALFKFDEYKINKNRDEKAQDPDQTVALFEFNKYNRYKEDIENDGASPEKIAEPHNNAEAALSQNENKPRKKYSVFEALMLAVSVPAAICLLGGAVSAIKYFIDIVGSDFITFEWIYGIWYVEELNWLIWGIADILIAVIIILAATGKKKAITGCAFVALGVFQIIQFTGYIRLDYFDTIRYYGLLSSREIGVIFLMCFIMQILLFVIIGLRYLKQIIINIPIMCSGLFCVNFSIFAWITILYRDGVIFPGETLGKLQLIGLLLFLMWLGMRVIADYIKDKSK